MIGIWFVSCSITELLWTFLIHQPINSFYFWNQKYMNIDFSSPSAYVWPARVFLNPKIKALFFFKLEFFRVFYKEKNPKNPKPAQIFF